MKRSFPPVALAAACAAWMLALSAAGADPIPTTDLILRLKPESLSALADGDAVSSWPDSSGLGYDAVQGTAASRPLYKTNVVNGYPAVRFGGTDDFLDTGIPVFASGRKFTAFVVVGNVGSGTQQPLLGTDSAVNYGAVFGRVNGNFRIQDDSNLSFEGGQVNLGSSFQIRSFERSLAGNIYPYVNGNADVAGSLGGAFNLSIIGARRGTDLAARLYMTGDIAEILVYSNQLSQTDRQMVEGSLAWTYGLQTSLPLAHPFRTTNPNDESTPELSVLDAPDVIEGNSASTTMSFTVSLSAVTSSPVTVQFATSNGTGAAGVDYVATNGTLSFTAPGSTTVQVQVTGDLVPEFDRTLYLCLSNAARAAISEARAAGRIVDDESYVAGGTWFPAADLVLWLRPELLAELANGAPIERWRDATAPRQDAVQATPAWRPTCRTNLLNGKAGAHFATTPVPQYLKSAVPTFDSGAPLTVYMVIGNASGCVLGHDNTAIYGSSYGYLASAFRLQDDSDHFYSGLPALTAAFQIRGFIRDTGNTMREYVNGTNSYTSSAGFFSGGITFTVLGGRPSKATAFLDGDVPELLIYSNRLSTGQRQLLEGCLAWKYGLEGNLPDSHPWRSVAPWTPSPGCMVLFH